MSAATVTSKGQITIPADIRQEFQIGPGDRLVFYASLDGNLRVHVRKKATGSGGAFLSARGRKASVDDMDEGIAAAVAERNRSGGGARR